MKAVVMLLWAALCCGDVHAAMPQMLNYQGYLTNPGGFPVNSSVTMTFRLYDSATAGTLKWSEVQPAVSVTNGVFDAVLGSVTPLPPLAFDAPYWLTVAVNADGEMTPRQQVTASPYAIRAANADALAPTATVVGSQITGAVSTATLPVTNLTGTIATAQLADASVTTAKIAGNGCVSGQILKYNGSAWTCAADNSVGTVTSITAGAGLTGGTITSSGTIAVDPASATLTSKFFKQGGNTFGALPNATAVLGVTDNALEIQVQGSRMMRFEPDPISPNLVGGYPANAVASGMHGGTIGGGGENGTSCGPSGNSLCANRVLAHFGTIGGGFANVAGGDAFGAGYFATIGGGADNTAHEEGGTIGGGSFNVAGQYASIGGGFANQAAGIAATVPGGTQNSAFGPVSFAAGTRAVAMQQNAFVWGGDPGSDTLSNGSGSFTINAPGGIYSNNRMFFGFLPRQMLNLFDTTYGIGVQNFVEYFRSATHFAWFQGGTHNDQGFNPGAGGQVMMTLSPSDVGAVGTGTAVAQLFINRSDRNAKTAFEAVDAGAVLDKVARLPLSTWVYRNDTAVRHIGPVAQDFAAAFHVGNGDKTISTVDAEGVALAAIQGLNARFEEQAAAMRTRLEERDARIAMQADALRAQASEMSMLKQQMAEMREALAVSGRVEGARLSAAR